MQLCCGKLLVLLAHTRVCVCVRRMRIETGMGREKSFTA